VWRVVEGQHVTSTRKLVDSPEEHDLLERVLDEHKPALPEEFRGLHWLLATPFRYPPLRHGSRFGRRGERSLFYGAEEVTTALAETAFYRLWFLEDSEAELSPLESEFTGFKVRVTSSKAIDLTAPPFSTFADRISSKHDFAEAQELGTEMRTGGVELFRYFSARQAHGINVGVFRAEPFVGGPFGEQHWHCFATKEAIEFSWTVQREKHLFPRSQFLVGGVLAPRPP
jgi:hypothetical protein